MYHKGSCIVEFAARYYDKKGGIYYFVRSLLGENEASIVAALLIVRSFISLMILPMYITTCKLPYYSIVEEKSHVYA